jgi:hypothetical protein
MGEQARFQLGFHLGGICRARKNHVAAGNVGFDSGEPGVNAHGLKLCHRQLAGAADIHRAQQCDVVCHFRSIHVVVVRDGCGRTQIHDPPAVRGRCQRFAAVDSPAIVLCTNRVSMRGGATKSDTVGYSFWLDGRAGLGVMMMTKTLRFHINAP